MKKNIIILFILSLYCVTVNQYNALSDARNYNEEALSTHPLRSACFYSLNDDFSSITPIAAKGGDFSSWIDSGIKTKTDEKSPLIDFINARPYEWLSLSSYTLRTSVSDEYSDISIFKYKTSGASSTGDWKEGHPNMSLIIDKQGVTYVSIFAVDKAGNSEQKNTYVRLDNVSPILSIQTSNTNWTNSDVILTVTTSDEKPGSGIGFFQNPFDSNYFPGSGVYSMSRTYNVSSNGVYNFRVLDCANNSVTANISIDNIDKVNPTVNFSPSSKSWSKSNFPVTISVGDDLSGVKSWRYATSSDDGETWKDWVICSGILRTVTISSEGLSKIKVEVTDNAGNTTSTVSGTYQLDKTNPTASFSPKYTTWINNNLDVLMSVNDNYSGIKSWRYAISSDNGLSWGLWTTGIGNSLKTTISNDGIFKIKIEATDIAGNVSTTFSGSYLVDKRVPQVLFSPNGISWTNENIVVTLTPTDNNGSGIEYWKYRVSSDNGNSWSSWSYDQPLSGTTLTFSTTGKWVIETQAKDEAGNIDVIRSNTYFIDKTSPDGIISIPQITNSRNLYITLENIFDLESGIKDIIVGNYKNDPNATIKKFSKYSNLSFSFELDKKDTIEENYGERNIYLTVRDNAGNTKDYVLTTTLIPKKPIFPLITSPKNDSFYLLNEKILLSWIYNDTNNDFNIPLEKIEVIIKNINTNKTTVYELNGKESLFKINDLEKGIYSISIKCYISDSIYSESLPVLVRVNIFKKSGNVKTISIVPGSKIKYISILTESEIPKGAEITGQIYYKTLNGTTTIDKSISIPFIITTDYRNNIIRLPEYSDKVEVEYFLNNNSDKLDISPALDYISVFAK